eukprot:s3758_g2.t1
MSSLGTTPIGVKKTLPARPPPPSPKLPRSRPGIPNGTTTTSSCSYATTSQEAIASKVQPRPPPTPGGFSQSSSVKAEPARPKTPPKAPPKRPPQRLKEENLRALKGSVSKEIVYKSIAHKSVEEERGLCWLKSSLQFSGLKIGSTGMGFAAKSLLFLVSLRLAASLAPGDCAFVGIYGDQDDFALVLLEDADGEIIRLTEELPQNGQLEVKKHAAAKEKVSNAKRGTVLKRADFHVDSTSFVAPLALTAFTGSDESPTVLCSINLDHSVRKLEESYAVNLGATDFAEYAGSGIGSKEQLQEDIMNTENWHHDQTRRLGGFTIASNVTVTQTTTMNMNTTTASMTMTTTMTTTLTVIEGIETKVEGCMEVSVSDFALLDGSDAAKDALRESIAAAAATDVDYVQNLTIMVGNCGARRQRRVRRLQTAVSINFVILFPPSLGAQATVQAAAAVAAIQGVSTTEFTTVIATKIAAIPELASTLTITVQSVPTASVAFGDETGVTKANGCIEFYTNDYATLSGFATINAEWTTIYASLFVVPELYIDNVQMQSGACTFSRRLADRRLSELGCVKWRVAWAPSRYGGIDGAYAAAQANITDLASADLAGLSATITSEIQTNADLTNVTIDVVAVDLAISESGVTTTTGDEEPPSHAAAASFASAILLVVFFRM